MKRLITFISLIVIIFLGYTFISKGFENEKVGVASYNEIEAESAMLTTKLAGYDKLNQEDYQTTKSTLESTIKSYKTSKEKYEKIYEELADILAEDPNSEEGEHIADVIYTDKEKYKMNFLQVRLGNYGAKHGVDVDISLSTSSQTDLSSSMYEYFLADIGFTVTGQYMSVTNFIADLENDADLGWEINDFQMASGASNGYTGVTAKFTVKGIPIDTQSYLESQQQQEQEQNPDNTTTDGNTVVDGNSVSNVVSNEVTNTTTNVGNTVSNTVSNNTVN